MSQDIIRTFCFSGCFEICLLSFLTHAAEATSVLEAEGFEVLSK